MPICIFIHVYLYACMRVCEWNYLELYEALHTQPSAQFWTLVLQGSCHLIAATISTCRCCLFCSYCCSLQLICSRPVSLTFTSIPSSAQIPTGAPPPATVCSLCLLAVLLGLVGIHATTFLRLITPDKVSPWHVTYSSFFAESLSPFEKHG